MLRNAIIGTLLWRSLESKKAENVYINYMQGHDLLL